MCAFLPVSAPLITPVSIVPTPPDTTASCVAAAQRIGGVCNTGRVTESAAGLRQLQKESKEKGNAVLSTYEVALTVREPHSGHLVVCAQELVSVS